MVTYFIYKVETRKQNEQAMLRISQRSMGSAYVWRKAQMTTPAINVKNGFCALIFVLLNMTAIAVNAAVLQWDVGNWDDDVWASDCTAGNYWNGTVCVDADAGSYVAIIGATSQTPCPVGTNSFAGASSCFPDLDGDSIADASDSDIDGDDIPNGIDADPLSAATATEITLPLDGANKGAVLGSGIER